MTVDDETPESRQPHDRTAGNAAAGHGDSRRAVIAAAFANLGIAAAKFLGFAVTGAASLLAEAIHSVADTANQGLLLFGGRRARRKPTAAHPFGYARERYFWAFVVSVVLFTAGGLFALFEGVEKLLHPHDPESLGWAIGILLVAIVFEALSLRTAVREARPEKHVASWRTFIRQSKSAELPVVLLEDTGALVGLGFALAGVVAAAATGDGRYDALGSLAIGALLVFIALTLAIEMKSLLIGEAATPANVEAIRRSLEDDPRVVRLLQLRTQQLGPDELLVGAKLQLDDALSGPEVVAALDEMEAALQRAVPDAVTVYLEPDSPDS
jgi:cation diffusion facilitator family transporter